MRKSILNNNSPLAKFYATMKVHKEPLKTRPIVSVSGTLLENLGVWVDCKLQSILPMFDSYFNSSTKLKQELVTLTFPLTARLFTANKISMYTNIPNSMALATITRFLCQHEKYTKEGLPYGAIIKGLGIIMR